MTSTSPAPTTATVSGTAALAPTPAPPPIVAPRIARPLVTTPLSSYAYRQQITITGGSAAVGGSTALPVPTTSTDYVVMLHLTGPRAAAVYDSATYNATSLYDGTPFADVTVWYIGGSSPQQFDIDYDTATYGAWSPDNVALSFKLQESLGAAPATDSSYVLAYGTANPTVLRDWANIYPFQDDFTGTAIDAAKWTPFGNVSASVASGVATISSSTIGDNGLKSTLACGTNYRVSMYGTLPIASSGSRGPTLRQWATPPSASPMVAIGTNPVNSPTQDEVSAYTVTGGWRHAFFAGTADPAYHVFSLARDADGTANGWVDQTSASVPGAASVDALNTVLDVFNNDNTATTALQADWIKVRPWIAVEPVASVSTGGDVPWHPHRMLRLASGLTASVDLSDGHLDLRAADVSLPARGLDLVFDHTWDSTMATAGVTTTAGQGWLDSLTPGIGGAITGTLVYTDQTGATWPLSYTGALTATSPHTAYQPPAGQSWAITATASTTGTTGYTLTDFLTGASQVFDGQGRLVADRDAYGNANTLGYTGDTPTSLTNSGGRSLLLTYQAGTGLLADVQSPLWQSGGTGAAGSQHIGYSYNSGGQLTGLTHGAGTTDAVTATFGYSGTQLVAITPTTALVQQWQIAYDGQGRVIGVTSPASGTTPADTTAYSYTPEQTTVVEGTDSAAPVTTTYGLGSQGEPITVTDALGNSTGYAYDADHDVTSTTDARGNTSSFFYQYVGPYSSAGLLTQTVAPPVAPYTTGNTLTPITTTYHYNGNNDLSEIDQPEGGVTSYGYDSHHGVITTTQLLKTASSGGCPMLAQRAPTAPTTSASATQPAASLTTATCTHSYTWRGTVTTRDAYGEITRTVDGRGVDVPNTTDGQMPVATLDPTTAISATRLYTYTAQGDLQQAGTPPISATAPGKATTLAPVVTTYGDDADGNQTAITSTNGYQTSLGYDHLGRLTTITHPSVTLYTGSATAPVETIGYDGDGNVVRTTDGAGDATTYGYDSLGRLTEETNPISGTTIYTYNATELTATQDPAGNVTSYSYDAAGRAIGRTDGTGMTTQYAYDAVGNTTAITTPLDAAHPQTATVEQIAYDALNRPVTTTILGTGEVTPTIPQTTLTTYDQDGNIFQQVAPNGDATAQTLDQADRAKWVEVDPAPLGGKPGGGAPPPPASQDYTFDAADNLTRQDDFTLRTHLLTLDGDNRLTQQQDCPLGCLGGGQITITPGYDPDGNVLSLLRQESGLGQTGAYTATYSALDWLASQDDGPGQTTYGYDAAGYQRTAALLVGTTAQSVVTSTVNAAGLVTQTTEAITDTGATQPTTSTSLFTYTADELPAAATLPSGGGSIQETRQYDGDNRLTCLNAVGPQPSGGANLTQSYGYLYNPLGRTTAISAYIPGATCDLSAPTTVQYLYPDAHGRLTQVASSAPGGSSAYSYDGDDNLRTVAVAGSVPLSYTYALSNGTEPAGWLPNELLSTVYTTTGTTAASYGYDSSGATTAITTSSGTAALTYTAQGQLAAVSAPGGTQIALTYNARGLRASETITDSGQPPVTETLRYRGGQIGQIAVTQAGTTPFTETFTYRPDGSPLELLYQLQGQPTARYDYILDGQGDVVALTGPNGTIANAYAYDVWGALDLTTPNATYEAIPQPFRYRGYFDEGWYDGGRGNRSGSYLNTSHLPLAWYALGPREYDPQLKRFLAPDPSAQDGVRSYVYCHADPADCSDPSGLSGDGPNEPEVPLGALPGGTEAPLPETPVGPAGGVQLPLPFDEAGSLSESDIAGSADPAAAAESATPSDPFDREAAIAAAREARANINEVPEGKTGAATASGSRTLSGWGQDQLRRLFGFDTSAYPQVAARAARMEFDFPADPRDQGVPGRFYASHAEPQLAEQAPNEPLATSRAMCSQSLSKNRGVNMLRLW